MPEHAAKVLVVDDERAVRTALQINLTKAGYAVDTAEDGEAALIALKLSPPDLVLSDLRMPRLDGMRLLESIKAHSPGVPVVLMTGQGSVRDAVQAMRAGASDYIIKPVRRDELLIILERTLRANRLEAEVARLREELEQRTPFEQIVGASHAMHRVYSLIDAVADSDALVLVTGPTGAGKELVARALHQRSRRTNGPFVALNCAALPEQLLESELFGHEKGAFTGAVRRHAGRFEQASGGTLLLDEIGEIPLSTQVRLLRVLESGEVQRVGGTSNTMVDTRVIAATNRDLAAEVAAGRFRKDLYYRLHVFQIPVPPLTHRREDIPALADHFIRHFARKHGRTASTCSRNVLDALHRHSWPGNVRELAHVLERAVLLTNGSSIEQVDIVAAPPDSGKPHERGEPVRDRARHRPLPDALRELETQLIVDALQQAAGVQAEAARILGVSRSNLHYRVKKLGIRLTSLQFGTQPV